MSSTNQRTAVFGLIIHPSSNSSCPKAKYSMTVTHIVLNNSPASVISEKKILTFLAFWCILHQNARNIFYVRELLRGLFSLDVCCVNCEQYKVELLGVGDNEILNNVLYPKQWEGNGGVNSHCPGSVLLTGLPWKCSSRMPLCGFL